MVDIVVNLMGKTNETYTANVQFSFTDHYHVYCIISNKIFETKNQNRI